MAKIIILQGLPASGKSTKAKELMEEYGNFVRLNRDLMRKMLHFDVWTGRNEGVTKKAQRSLAKALLENGQSVIVDDTNLNGGTIESWKGLAKELDAKFEIVKIETPIYECILRDENRENKVGPEVIKNMARLNGMWYSELPDVICDLDGTLCSINHRLHFVKPQEKASKKDWKGFYEALRWDAVRLDVARMLAEYSKECNIVFVSGRPEEYKQATKEWLSQQLPMFGFGYDTLIMRRSGDKRPDYEVKKDILDAYFRKGKIKVVIDDRPSVIRMWKEKRRYKKDLRI